MVLFFSLVLMVSMTTWAVPVHDSYGGAVGYSMDSEGGRSNGGGSPATEEDSLIHTFLADGREYTLKLERYSIRGEQFEVIVEEESGERTSYTPGPSRTYFGTVAGDPYGSAAAIVMADGSVHARVYLKGGATLFVVDDSVVQRRGWEAAEFTFPATNMAQYRDKSSTDEVYSFILAVDASYDYYQDFSTSQEVVDYIEFSLAAVHTLYVRDAMLAPRLGQILLRTSQDHCPYEGLDQGDVLSTLRDIWGDAASAPSFTNVAYVSSRWAGMAYMPGIASINSGGNDGYFDVIFRHELGHNWGAADWHAGSSDGGVPEGATIMSGNSFGRISGPTVHTFLSHRDTYFSDRHVHPVGLEERISYPPYAMLGLYEIMEGTTVFELDPTENDHDANGDSLFLVSFDSTTAKGLSITSSDAGLPQINLGDTPWGTEDFFFYEIENSRGLRDRGVVYFRVAPPYKRIPRERLSIESVSSYQPGSGDASHVLDGDLSTIWHSQWGDNPPPHDIVLAVDSLYTVGGLEYTPRQEGVNGRILSYEVYASVDGETWGDPLVVGEWGNTAGVKNAYFPTLEEARYIRLRSLEGTNNNSSAADIGIWYMPDDTDDPVSLQKYEQSRDRVQIAVGQDRLFLSRPFSETVQGTVRTPSGRTVYSFTVSAGASQIDLPSGMLSRGVYLISLDTPQGHTISRLITP
ncbi:discoidin domain-containing protein [Chitinivibrio alkaliphilus]|uniref:Putative lipoprotein n=1 Tax=Chitinivibrio alkaliphilus ACht1 TaxID=1313304 RepID=U7D8U4_9BACT|nr:discoidin domain-containing protein [Chitinivibrio alkaliphilus]ERP31522.1 putative lipoprotein [Chitinivibrio alkaliphilus ACht1]